jgi:SAM-dependent methyltransferase
MARIYDAAYAGVPNWDIGRPQRAFVHLVEARLVRGPVLDVGCGTGELSIFLARAGYDVLGIDLSVLAIRQAQEKAEWRRVPARFLVWNALDLPGLADGGFRFRTVVDSAMFHVLGDAERNRFIDGLETVLKPGGLYCVLGDARRNLDDIYGLPPTEFRDRFDGPDGRETELPHDTGLDRRRSPPPASFAGISRR